MTSLDALILGIVEGLTEFLPVSSTGHLVLTARLLQLPDSEFLRTFEVVIQLGAIAAVAWHARKYLGDLEALKRVGVAFVPAAVVGLALYEGIKSLLGSPMVVVWALLLGGIFLIAFEKWYARAVPAARAERHVEIAALTYRQAFVIGLCQAIAAIPGVSRSGASIVGGLAQRLPRATAVEFSFLLAIPTLLAAAAKDLAESRVAFDPSQVTALGIGLLTSFAIAAATVRFLLRYIRTNDFTSFGIYRIALAAAFWLIVLR